MTLYYRCGPISRYWCMRFEAKHNYFKSLAQRVKCYKNIAKTLSSRHQKLMCYYLCNPLSSPIIKGIKTSKGLIQKLYRSMVNAINYYDIVYTGLTLSIDDYEYRDVLREAAPMLDGSATMTRYIKPN